MNRDIVVLSALIGAFGGGVRMWLWHKFMGFFQTWYGSVAGAIGILGTIYNGVPQMFKTWDFLIDRFRDQPVLEVLHYVRLPKKLAPFNPTGPGQV